MLVFKFLLCLFFIIFYCMCILFIFVFFFFCCGIVDCFEGIELKLDGICVKCLYGYYCSILEDVCMKCLVGIIIDRDGSESVENCYLSI